METYSIKFNPYSLDKKNQKKHWKLLGLLVFIVFAALNIVWLSLNSEDRSSDEAVFLYFAAITTKSLEAGSISIPSAYFNTVSFRPPLISLQVIPWIYIGFTPFVAAIISQSVWLLLIYLASRTFIKDQFSPLLASTLLFLTPYFTCQIRELHTDLGCAALTLATYSSFFSITDVNNNKSKSFASTTLALFIGLGMLMRPDFIINIAPLGIATISLYLQKNYLAFRRILLACIFSLPIFLPWYIKNWNNFFGWLKGNAVIGSMSKHELIISRIEILAFFAIGCLISISPILLSYLKSSSNKYQHLITRCNFLVISGFLIIAIHLLIDISLPTRTRMLLSAAALVVIGIIGAKIYSKKIVLMTLAISITFSTYLSFFYAPELKNRNIGIINAIPHKSTYNSQAGEILTACKAGRLKDQNSNIRILVQPYGIYTYESMLLESLKNKGIEVSTDLFTPQKIQFDYSIYDCFLAQQYLDLGPNRTYQQNALHNYLENNPVIKINKIITDNEGNKIALYIR